MDLDDEFGYDGTIEPERQPMGFTVITERGDEPAAESYFTDDD